MVQATCYVIEMTKDKYIVQFLKKIVIYFCNKKHLPSCQIYVRLSPGED